MNTFAKSSLLALTLLGTSFALTPAFAADENNVAPGMTYAGAPLGLHGSDPVALLNGTQVDGNPQHFAAHDGVAYYFATAENKAAFEENPSQYTPENGGFCTLGVAFAKKLDGNPEYSAVVHGKLFVFLNADVLSTFMEDKTGIITKADENWPTIRSTAAAEL